jgi:hypothetical protein
MPSVDEEQLREDYATLEAAKAQLEGLAKQQQLIQLAVEEHSSGSVLAYPSSVPQKRPRRYSTRR